MLDGSSGVAELLPTPLVAAVDACAREPVLYVADVERTLLLLVGCRPASARSAARPLEQELARELGAKEARTLAVRLASAEVEQLAAIAERPNP